MNTYVLRQYAAKRAVNRGVRHAQWQMGLAYWFLWLAFMHESATLSGSLSTPAPWR